MKSKTIPYLLGMSAILFTGQVFAQGHGTSGGAQTVMTPQGRELRDLLGNSCSTLSGDQLIEIMPALKERIESIKKVYWYFGFSLEREVRRMNFCFTDAEFNPTKLPRVNDRNGVLMITAPQSTEFMAIRIFQSKEAYIRKPLYNGLSERSKAMTILHETLHSFIPLNAADRDLHLRNFVSDLAELDATRTSAATSLEGTMRFNRIDFPLRSKVKRNTAYLEFVLGTTEQQRAAILNRSITLKQILNPPRIAGSETLVSQDQDYLNSIQGNEQQEFLALYCENDDQEVLEALRAQYTSNFDIDLYCFSLQSTQDDLKGAPSETTMKAVNRKLETLYRGLIDSTVEIRRERIQVSGGVRILSQANGNPLNSIEALQLNPIQSLAAEAPLSGETRILIGLFVILAKTTEANEWIQIVSQNQLLVQALNEKPLMAKVQALNAPMSEEKRAVLDLIPRVYQQFKTVVAQELKNQNLEAHAQAWNQLFN